MGTGFRKLKFVNRNYGRSLVIILAFVSCVSDLQIFEQLIHLPSCTLQVVGLVNITQVKLLVLNQKHLREALVDND